MTYEQQKYYDALQKRIQSFVDAGRHPPEELLNGSFNFINSLMVCK